jgi:hypothetical protein
MHRIAVAVECPASALCSALHLAGWVVVTHNAVPGTSRGALVLRVLSTLSLQLPRTLLGRRRPHSWPGEMRWIALPRGLPGSQLCGACHQTGGSFLHNSELGTPRWAPLPNLRADGSYLLTVISE